jgi:hypothetical protein
VLLGHAKLDTTALYTHVANTTIRTVTSPLGRLPPRTEGRPRTGVVGKIAPVSATGDDTVDSLPDWALSIIAVAVGLSSGLPLLMARLIGRFLRRVLLERPEVAPQSGREPVRVAPAVAAPPG